MECGGTVEPIRVYENLEALKQSMEEWKRRLFLDSWIITVGYHNKDQYPGDNGHVNFSVENETAAITLLSDENEEDMTIKTCQELVLVHELLHLKMGFIAGENTIEGNLYEVHQHRLIYELSKSLIMAKYGIGLDWFKKTD